MYTFFVILLILTSILLVISVLMQSSKGDGMVAMTAGSSVLGGRGAATFLSKFTQWAGILFFVLILAINITVARRDTGGAESVVQRQSGKQVATQASGLSAPANIEIEQPTEQPQPEERK
ncbi:MAG: preprotein translocase subunit SecG [Candidatus Marinimicrobia bacterium]|jgi:preprotein translocase subunit SecG|nr:preprotein translocase subunit SecG [Candidatus Neomarinimicrobiota bacterium]MDD5709992.1 preprotein translocase subunit SecG [Candidatus Neomarinimicrobiota bacterium]MDX9777275.1 preprotein translocase subunit SecG [bacterium]